jgi:hypothetical protein
MAPTAAIPDDRPLTAAESALIQWLLEHGIPQAADCLPQLDRARVASRCYCGCASINFAVDGVIPPPGGGISNLADYEWRAPGGELFGVFVFERCGLLAGLEVWSQDGLAEASSLPVIEQLQPIGMCPVAEQKVAPDCGGIT